MVAVSLPILCGGEANRARKIHVLADLHPAAVTQPVGVVTGCEPILQDWHGLPFVAPTVT
jgi:hypothetical protein